MGFGVEGSGLQCISQEIENLRAFGVQGYIGLKEGLGTLEKRMEPGTEAGTTVVVIM